MKDTYFDRMVQNQKNKVSEQVKAEKEISKIHTAIRHGLKPLNVARAVEKKRRIEENSGTPDIHVEDGWRPKDWTESDEARFLEAFHLMRCLRILETKHNNRKLTPQEVLNKLRTTLVPERTNG